MIAAFAVGALAVHGQMFDAGRAEPAAVKTDAVSISFPSR